MTTKLHVAVDALGNPLRVILSAGQITGYLLRMLFCAVLWLAGIFLEVYCNPKITEILIKNLKIF